jgi:hypothetical protein
MDLNDELDAVHADIESLKGRASALEGVDNSAAVLDDIRQNGLYFGDNWWFGSQGDQLYAIDINSPSFYRFQAGVNATLGEQESLSAKK